MASGVEHAPEKRAEILALLGQGKKIREVEEITGVAWQTIYGWRRKEPQWATDMDTARHMYSTYRRDLALERKDWVEDELYTVAENTKDDRLRSSLLLELHKIHAKQVQRFEITGDGGGPVAIQHEQRLTLAHLYAFARAVPGFSDTDIGELPDARPVLPAPEDGGTAAGALPAGPVS